MTLPGAWLEEYLAAEGLGTRLAILSGRFPMPPASLEAALELSLEASWLFQRFPLPELLEARILAAVDSLEGDLLVRASGPSCGASGFELWSAGTRAALLSAVRVAWSRAYSPGSGSTPAWPTIAIVERDSLSAEELALVDRWGERLSDGRYLGMAPQDLAPLLEAAASAAGTGEDVDPVPLAELGAYIRYALGWSYNSVLAPDDPFRFLGLLSSGGEAKEVLRERYLAMSQAGGRAGEQSYIELAERSLALEAGMRQGDAPQSLPDTDTGTDTDTAGPAVSPPDAPPARRSMQEYASSERGLAAPGPSSPGCREDRVYAQQLTGMPSSPGRATGILHRISDAGTGMEARPAEAVVLVCERFTHGLLTLKPAAVIERQGGRLGAGALLARAVGIPCVSGVRDAGILPEGAGVWVDGWLGVIGKVNE